VREATRTEISAWDELVTANPDGGNILQTRAWGESKFAQGWRPLYLIGKAAGTEIAVLILRRGIAGLGELWYSPKGPGVGNVEQLTALLGERTGMQPVFCLKVEPELEDNPHNRNGMRRLGAVKVPDVQIHRATVIVDLDRDEDALMASFKAKTRYNIRLAARRGVTVEAVPCDEAMTATFYRLYADTATRAGFALRPERYYTRYWRLLEASGQGQLFVAHAHGEIIAGLYAGFLGDRGWYKDGGSANQHRELMAPHLLQWEAMRWLRRHGVRTYDLVAVPRREDLNERHPMWGLWRFKSGFCDEITEFVGAWDIPLDGVRYAAWRRIGERIAQRWSWRVRGDLLY